MRDLRFLGAITTGCMRPFVPRTNKNGLTTTNDNEGLGGAGIMAVWQVALVKQLRIMGSNPSQPHILAEGRRKA